MKTAAPSTSTPPPPACSPKATTSTATTSSHPTPPTPRKPRARPSETVPVLVEGPLDAIAVTLAGQGRYIGVATLGTALTPVQAAAVAAHGVEPVQALDNDPAGQTAATRNFWRLTQYGLDPQLATLPPHQDPADVFTGLGPSTLRRLIDQATPQGDYLLHHNGHPVGRDAVDVALRITAARPPHTWADSIDQLSRTHHMPVQELRERFIPLAHDATRQPADAARRGEALTRPPVPGRPSTRNRPQLTPASTVEVAAPLPDRSPAR